jgi:hypothetical protein
MGLVPASVNDLLTSVKRHPRIKCCRLLAHNESIQALRRDRSTVRRWYFSSCRRGSQERLEIQLAVFTMALAGTRSSCGCRAWTAHGYAGGSSPDKAGTSAAGLNQHAPTRLGCRIRCELDPPGSRTNVSLNRKRLMTARLGVRSLPRCSRIFEDADYLAILEECRWRKRAHVIAASVRNRIS